MTGMMVLSSKTCLLVIGLAVLLAFVSTTVVNGQLNPNRPPHKHIEFVRQCMEPYLDRCDDDKVKSETNNLRNGGDNENDDSKLLPPLNFRPSQVSDLVEIAPTDDPAFTRESLNESDRQQLFYLATCVAYAGRLDPYGHKQELDLVLTEETIREVWDHPFEFFMPHTHAEERHFAGQDGGNRVVYLQEFLQTFLPEVYWKLRETGYQAVQAGKAAGLFQDPQTHLPLSMLGIREVEYIEYLSGDGNENHLRWHRDSDSIYTLVHHLTEQGKDYEGGTYSIKTFKGENGSAQEGNFASDELISFNPTIGSGLLFNAEVHHGVAPITSGRRKVLVIEFWIHGEVDLWEWRPPLERAGYYPAVYSPDEIPEGCDLEKGLYQRPCWPETEGSVWY